MVAGVTEKLPPVMFKVGAPDAVIEKPVPEQIVPLLTVMVGLAITDTVITAVFDETQPPVDPVIEYEVVVAGDTVKLLPVIV